MKLVLIHLGNALPNHLSANLESLTQRFPDVDLHLVSDVSDLNYKNFPKLGFHKYVRSGDVDKALSTLSHDLKFREGFWSHTIERFFALSQFHQIYPNEPVLHIESDILLLPKFPFEEISTIQKLSWLRVDSNRDVAALIFSPNYQETEWFSESILEELRKNPLTTDMTALSQVRNLNNERVQVFPSLFRDHLIPNASESVPEREIRISISEKIGGVEGIFDPAAYGMWLTGSDPRNYYGRQIMFDTTEIIKGGTFVDPSRNSYSLSDKGELYLENGSIRVRLWNLHVHSKDLELLGRDWHQRLSYLVALSNKGHIHSEFRLRALLKLVVMNLRNRTFLSWILHIPSLKPIVELLRKLRDRLTVSKD